MFDKLIESNSAGAEFKPRRKFFMMSSVVVGILFLSALVFSLYAAEIDLGTDNFELAELLAPIAPDAPEPEPPPAQPQERNEQQRTELPSRPELIARIDQPQQVPTEISTTPNTTPPIPVGPFVFDPSAPTSNGTGPIGPTGPGSGLASVETPAEVVKLPEPPPVAPKVEAPKRPVSIGVANGRATYLPKPAYPPPALAVRAEGEVTVQVTIDEAGKVISAKAVSGHPLLKGVSEKAAWNARFTPTLLSNVPVKVTGIIVYKFSRS